MKQDYQPKDKWTVDKSGQPQPTPEASKPKQKIKIKIRWLLLIILMVIGAFYSLFHHRKAPVEVQQTQAQVQQPKEVHIQLNLPNEPQTHS